MIEHTIHRDKNGGVQIMRHETEALQHEADLAVALVRGFGLIAMVPLDENNPDGSQKHRALTPEETVTRACLIARLTYDNIRAMGWTTEAPSLFEGPKDEKKD